MPPRGIRGRHGHERHRSERLGWLRAAVLGANDGLVSTSSLVVAVASSGASRAAVLTAGVAGLIAGALSMAAGEYVSVGSQRDSERAELHRERVELAAYPDAELDELAAIYRHRGVSPAVARQVASELMAHDALAAHARDELGLTEQTQAQPLQAAWTSAVAFAGGAVVPVAAFGIVSGAGTAGAVVATLVGLAGLGWVGAVLGGAPRPWAAARVLAGGSLAMALSAVAGDLAGNVIN